MSTEKWPHFYLLCGFNELNLELFLDMTTSSKESKEVQTNYTNDFTYFSTFKQPRSTAVMLHCVYHVDPKQKEAAHLFLHG